MTMTADVRPVVLITNETTRAELAVTLALLNADAKQISRRGKVGTLSEAYRVAHARIDVVLADYWDTPA